jgi:hypothetical protein
MGWTSGGFSLIGSRIFQSAVRTAEGTARQVTISGLATFDGLRGYRPFNLCFSLE